MKLSRICEEIQKSGEITLEKIGLGGVIPEAEVIRLIDLIIEEESFLKSITVISTTETVQPMNQIEIEDNVLQNLPEGEDPVAFSGGQNSKRTLNLKPTNSFMRLLFSTLRSAKGKRALDEIQRGFVKRFGENLVKVGFVGTERVETTADITKIAKGWIQQAKDSEVTHKVNSYAYLADGQISWVKYLKAVIKALPGKFKDATRCEIVMNPSDYDDLVDEIAEMKGGISYLITGDIPRFKGYKVRRISHMSSGTVVFTNIRNFQYGIQQKMENHKDVSGTKRQITYTYIVVNDYGIAVEDAFVIGYPIAPIPEPEPEPVPEPEVPEHAPAGVTFTDTDETADELGGDIVIQKAADESDITHYVLYFGTDATTKTTEIAQLPKTGANITFTLPDGTAKGANTHILAYSKNDDGLCEIPAAVEIVDNTGA